MIRHVRVIGVMVAALVAIVQAGTPPTCMTGAARLDCLYGDQNSCEYNGCCWSPVTSHLTVNFTDADFAEPPRHLLGGGTPWCFHPQQIVDGYTVTNAQKTTTPPGWTLDLALYDGNNYFGTDTPRLQVDVSFETARRLRVKIFDPDTDRWEIPESILPLTPPDVNVGAFMYSFSYTEKPFGFAVTRVDDGEVIFNTTAPLSSDGVTPLFNGLVFEDQYLEISSQLPPEPIIYGLGEKVTSLQLATNGQPITFWARDAPTPRNQNIYGSHPVYMENRRTPLTDAEIDQRTGPIKSDDLSTKTHGVWLRNSNGMDVLLYGGASADARVQADASRRTAASGQPGVITYRVIGGILDFFIYVGSSVDGSSRPEAIAQEYHKSVGFPHMPPLWSLGFHQCRWGYKNLSTIEYVVEQYAKNQIPLDTQWNDIDYMDAFEDFSVDPVNYPADMLASFIEALHTQGQHYMLIMDPAIHNRTGYATFDSGLEKDVFIKQANGDLFVGQVWPGATAFPSFMAPNTPGWWAENIATFRAMIPTDGLWIDMNEASNFCNGDCDHPSTKTAGPYRIDNGGAGMDLNIKTLDIDAVHGQGWIEYDVHNMYGLTESILTNLALESQMQTRSLVISRSTFSGSGAHTGHWLGDNWSTWESMADSIPGILAMQFFGLPLVGADICGFNGESNEELCARWMALGSFYPFSRNHNVEGAASQEPYVWASVAAVSRTTLGARYSLLHVYNTLFFNANMNGGTVVRPLFFNFPDDVNTFPIGSQFMIGSSVLITPVLTQGATSVKGYWPLTSSSGQPQRWYDWWTRAEFTAPAASGGWVTVPAPLNTIPVHIAGGSILPLQQPALTTVRQANNPFDMVVACDSLFMASGSLFMDDGLTLNIGSNTLQSSFLMNATLLEYTVQSSEYAPASSLAFESIVVLGSSFGATSPSKVTVNGDAATFQFDQNTHIITVTQIALPLNQPFKAIFWQ